MKTLHIDSELCSWLPDLDDEENEGLEERLLAEGIREPLVVWRGKDVIVDGHHRYEIAQKHRLDFDVSYMDFDDKEAVKDWIDKNALARRNLSPDQAALLRGRVYNRRKKPAHAGENQYSRGGEYQNDTHRSTAATLAKEYGVSEPTIKRDGKYAEAYDTLAPEVPEVFESGKKPTRQAVVEAANKWKSGDKEAAVETLKRPHVSNNSGENEWYTPEWITTLVRTVMGDIDLDPASSAAANGKVGAAAYYTIDDDGLSKSWRGRVWLNPPYTAALIPKFIDKLISEWSAGNIGSACVIVNNATETRWCQRLLNEATAVCFLEGRVRYWQPDKQANTPLQGQIVALFGSELAYGRFLQEFSKVGTVFRG